MVRLPETRRSLLRPWRIVSFAVKVLQVRDERTAGFNEIRRASSGCRLLVIPGGGSELYRSLAAVIIGGICVSAAFTLLLLPSLLRIGEGSSRPAEERAAEPVTA